MERDITAELDAAKAEQGEDNVLSLWGEKFELKGFNRRASVELGRFAKDLNSKDDNVRAGAIVALDDAMRAMLGDEQYARMDSLDLSNAQWMIVLSAMTDLATGQALGESVGSVGSSQNTGDQPKPTSNGSTASTSPSAIAGKG